MEISKAEFNNITFVSKFWKQTFFLRKTVFRTFDFVASRIFKIKNK